MPAAKKDKDGLEAALEAIDAETAKVASDEEPNRSEDLFNLVSARRALSRIVRRREYRARA